MGSACIKAKQPRDSGDDLKGKSNYSRPQVRHFNGSARIETIEVLNGIVSEKDRERSKSRRHDSMDKRRESHGHRVSDPNPRSGTVPKQVEGEQVAAGWPAWLSAVAGEAIRGWIPRGADSFKKLSKIGQGTYSNVYKARDLDSGRVVALKKVRFDSLEPESVKFMAREIQILRRLDHPNVIKLEGLVTSRMSSSLYLVFEYMEHDLAGLAANPGIVRFTEPQIKCYLQQLLRGLEHCHTRCVLHRDIKGSNLLIGNDGILKIADFGLATFYRPDQRVALTSRVVTLWYRPPELLLGATDYNIGVDLWSTGCILAELLSGKPILNGRTEVEQLHKIFKLCGSPSEDYWKKSKLPHATIFKPQQPYKRCIADVFKEFPATALALIETLLAIEPVDRGDATAALKTDFFTTKPFPCDPTALPKYPPSKEFDAKMRDEEARRQRATRHGGTDNRRQGSRERGSRAAPDANAELQVSLQKRRHLQSHSSKSKSEKFQSLGEKTATGFPIEPPPSKHGQQHPIEVRGTSPVGPRQFVPPASSRSGPMMNPAAWAKKQQEEARMAPPRPPTRSNKSDAPAQGRHWQTTTTSGSRQSPDAAAGKAQDAVRQTDEEFPRHLRNNMRQAAETRRASRDEGDSRRSDVFRGPPNELSNIPEMSNGRDLHHPGYDERMFHSGPLLRPGLSSSVDIDELLEEHDRKLQQAVKRAMQGNPTSEKKGEDASS